MKKSLIDNKQLIILQQNFMVWFLNWKRSVKQRYRNICRQHKILITQFPPLISKALQSEPSNVLSRKYSNLKNFSTGKNKEIHTTEE